MYKLQVKVNDPINPGMRPATAEEYNLFFRGAEKYKETLYADQSDALQDAHDIISSWPDMNSDMPSWMIDLFEVELEVVNQ